MTMASGPSPPTLDDMMQNFKSIYDFLKPWFEPSSSKAKPKQDLSATINGPQGSGFMQAMRMLTEMMSPKPDSSLDSAKAGSKSSTEQKKTQGAQKNEGGEESGTAAGGLAGSTGSRSLTRGDRVGSKPSTGQTNTNPQDSQKNEGGPTNSYGVKAPLNTAETMTLNWKIGARNQMQQRSMSQGVHKSSTIIAVTGTNPLSMGSDSPQTTTDVNAGSVNQPEGGASQKKHDKDIEKLEKEAKELLGQTQQLAEERFEFKNKFEQEEKINKKLDKQINSLQQQVNSLQQQVISFEKRINEDEIALQDKNKTLEVLLDTRNKHLQDISALDNAVKKYQQDIEDRDRTIMSVGNDLQSLSKEHNDLKSRFSKLAGHKLTDQNPDIADLSDPNRAMKLSEKFGALYDDAWTDAFEHLTDEKQKLKLKPKEAIEFLLDCLKECWGMCQKEAEAWMNSLQNNFLHPVQDTEAMSKMTGGKSALRLGSKDLRVIRDACRKIAPTVGVLVKQCFIMKIKKNQKNQKLIDDCMTYLEGCVDVCWLMVLAEPPLHIDFNIKPGDKFDSNRHAAYSSTGEKVEFLVWPPLYNAEEKGGMLSKGTVSTERKIEKPSKK